MASIDNWHGNLFVIGGISAWYILRQRQAAFFARSFKIVVATALIVAPLQVYIGHLSAEQVYHYQPTKLAALFLDSCPVEAES